jgi:SAM-dependent methyltransferase
MTNVLIPGRHLITTAFMEEYLEKILSDGLDKMTILGEYTGEEKVEHIIIPITSANQHGSRYNPVPLYARVIGLERTMSLFRQKYNIHISYVPIPHNVGNIDFSELTLKYVAAHLDKELSPDDTVVWCSTPSLITQYREHGFTVLPAEQNEQMDSYESLPPNEILSSLAKSDDYKTSSSFSLLSTATQTLWEDMPEIPEHIFRLWNDPLLTESGSLTEERNYASYSVGMSHGVLMDVKYGDIKDAIIEGKIVDEGCADGALMVRLAETFPDSDIIGLDITGEFVSRVEERQRAGEFGGSFVHVYQRNILKPVFAPNSIQTTICNSTLHELWSYGKQAESVRGYLKEKFRQLAPGGRLVIRDVVGPENKDDLVYMKLSALDGEVVTDADRLLTADTATLSTETKFFRFAHDFLHDLRESGRRTPDTQMKYVVEEIDGVSYIKLTLKNASEFLSRKDYHDSWDSEMNEEFSFWDIKQWQAELSKIGFTIIHDDAIDKKFSGAYVNQWIVQNRWQPCVTIYKKNTEEKLVEQPFPVTNMVLVGEKSIG